MQTKSLQSGILISAALILPSAFFAYETVQGWSTFAANQAAIDKGRAAQQANKQTEEAPRSAHFKAPESAEAASLALTTALNEVSLKHGLKLARLSVDQMVKSGSKDDELKLTKWSEVGVAFTLEGSSVASYEALKSLRERVPSLKLTSVGYTPISHSEGATKTEVSVVVQASFIIPKESHS